MPIQFLNGFPRMMASYDPKSVFLKRSAAHMHINALGQNWEREFATATENLTNSELQGAFKVGFANAVIGKDITAREYEIATGWDFDTEGEYRGHLRTLWNIFYPGESPDDYAGSV